MTPEDPIIDPLLEELLGDQQMPDLTARIVLAHQQRLKHPVSSANNGHAKAPLSLHGATHPVGQTAPDAEAAWPHQVENPQESAQRAGKSEQARRRLRRQRQFASFGSLALSLCLLVFLGGVAYYGYQRFVPGQGIPLAADGEQSPSRGTRGDHVSEKTPLDSPRPEVTGPQIASHDAASSPVVSDVELSEIPPPQAMPAPAMPREVEVVEHLATNERPQSAPRHVSPKVRDSLEVSDQQVVSLINESIASVWAAENVKPSPAATDHEFCRRTYLQLLGRIPTVEEIERFVSHRGREKRQWLVDELLTGEKYSAEFASFWSARFANILVGRAGGMSAGSPIDRQALEGYLAEAFENNTPYHQVVQQLITAEGTTRPGTEAYNPATNFLVGLLDGDAKLATARTCSTFLGQQLQCAECHTHPSTGWGQEKFWGMNAFFRQTKLAKDRSGQLAIIEQDFAQTPQSSAGEVYYEQPNGLIKVAYPEFIDGTKIPASGKLAEVDRRQELGQLIVNSEQFPKATVNRIWQHFFGVGFTQPVDDMGPHNPASHPELLDNLANHFAESGFDLRRLMRWITLSQPYGLSSRQIDENLADNPEAGQPLFARYYTRQMEAEQLFHSLQMLAKNPRGGGPLLTRAGDRHTWLGQITQKMGDDEDSESTALDGGITQSMLLMNGGLMRQATDAQAAVLQKVTASQMTPREKVEHLFLAALSRRPSKQELSAIDEILRHRAAQPAAALQDIWWALLNSNEFILDH